MATLENIRKRGPLLAVVIGFALVAFILGDLLNSGSSMFGGDRSEVANISDESISIQEFTAKVEEQSAYYKSQGLNVNEQMLSTIRDQVWQQFIMQKILSNEYSSVGLRVGSEEMMDLLQGANPSPLMRNFGFVDQKTGKVDRARVNQLLNSLDQLTPQQKAQWVQIENQIAQQKLQEKYSNLVTKGLYVTAEEGKTRMKSTNKKVNINFLLKDYNTISDSAVTVSNSDVKDYYKKNKNKYKQDETRDIAYVAYEVVPSEEDTKKVEKWINRMKEEFASTKNDEQFVT